MTLLAGFGLAGTDSQPAGSQEETRTMTTTADTSNECVGDPRTPLCALETWSACILWSEPSLCEKVGLDGQQFRENESDFFEWEHTFRQITTRTVDAVHLSGIEAGEFAALRAE